MKSVRMLSWNVNGLRAALNKGFTEFVKREKQDILCIQEIKLQEGQVDLHFDGYYDYWNYAERKGYAGTAIFTRIKPIVVINNIGIEEHDKEGRLITLEFEDYFLVNVYTPNSKRELTRLSYRQKWDKDFLYYLKNLEKKKPVIFCGDLNVAHKEIDLANPERNRVNAGFTDEERAGFTNIVQAGFIDTFREFHKQPGQYTWWSYMFH
ncbi:MAG: exodeoxyribonuclease III, partial [Candidatus Cloacimonadota bacterium]|nr:exodeoxyribonuclease III [Candidatus Cloacimonadota bacterium]